MPGGFYTGDQLTTDVSHNNLYFFRQRYHNVSFPFALQPSSEHTVFEYDSFEYPCRNRVNLLYIDK